MSKVLDTHLFMSKHSCHVSDMLSIGGVIADGNTWYIFQLTLEAGGGSN